MITMDDNYRLEEFGFKAYLDHEHQATPEIRRKTMPIPGMAGSWNFGSEIGERHFNIPLKLSGEDQVSMQYLQSAFITFLFDAFGKPRPIKMSFDYEPDKHYTVELSSVVTPNTAIYHFKNFGLPLVASDPMKYASANQYDPDRDIYYGHVQDGDYYDNPQSFQWQYERHYSGINNYSSLVADFMIEIAGTVTDPSVTNLNTNQTLTLPSINNGRLVIDGKRFVVIKDGQEILDGSNYNFFHIQPGAVGFLFEGENPSATVNYGWLHKFM
ncbi:phage tail domain-containing protein [Oceanobacillus alkalisoli]|uniref:phage tail domain-containing protein n=1 Tax=Oceanobacillus alkalisoli TaxID=2925113 RepID=UPI001EE4E03A|nr:phage tail domain-containing protein [Oceanobacillus alkalisoli]MCG5104454.1 phage tail family protein [Oceanobacillus alkalisoli]